MLENVVERGGGKQAKLEGYRIGGKTGTAQISGGKSGYIKDDYLTSFVGFFPADKPRKYLGIIMFYKPQVSNEVRYGGLVAAPVFREVIKRITMNKSILSNDIAQIESQRKQNKKDYEKNIRITTMPDVTGMSLREVMNMFKNENFNIKAEGIGTVEKHIYCCRRSFGRNSRDKNLFKKQKIAEEDNDIINYVWTGQILFSHIAIRKMNTKQGTE